MHEERADDHACAALSRLAVDSDDIFVILVEEGLHVVAARLERCQRCRVVIVKWVVCATAAKRASPELLLITTDLKRGCIIRSLAAQVVDLELQGDAAMTHNHDQNCQLSAYSSARGIENAATLVFAPRLQAAGPQM